VAADYQCDMDLPSISEVRLGSGVGSGPAVGLASVTNLATSPSW